MFNSFEYRIGIRQMKSEETHQILNITTTYKRFLKVSVQKFLMINDIIILDIWQTDSEINKENLNITKRH